MSRVKYLMSHAREGGPVGMRACGVDPGGTRHAGYVDVTKSPGSLEARAIAVSTTPPSNSSQRRMAAEAGGGRTRRMRWRLKKFIC